MTAPLAPDRGEVWLLDLNPVRGHEQGGTRPALIVSADAFNHGPADLVVVVPITSRAKGIPSHVPIEPPEGGLPRRSYIKCEDIRSVSRSRLVRRCGAVSPATIAAVEDCLRILLVL